MRNITAFCSLGLACLAVCPAKAAGITYDCDTPSENFSELIMPQFGPFRVSGNLQMVVLRESSRYLPMGRIAVRDDSGSPDMPSAWAGLTFTNMVGSREVPTGLLVTELVLPGNQAARTNLRAASARTIAFTLTFDGARVTGMVDGQAFELPFSAANPAVQINCSTGEFLFTNLEISPYTLQ